VPGQLGLELQGAVRRAVLFGARSRALNFRGLAQEAFERNFRFSSHFLLQLNNSLLNLNILQQARAGRLGRMVGGAIAGEAVGFSCTFPLCDLLGETLVAHIFETWHCIAPRPFPGVILLMRYDFQHSALEKVRHTMYLNSRKFLRMICDNEIANTRRGLAHDRGRGDSVHPGRCGDAVAVSSPDRQPIA
jgi:hypothetical protein